MYNSSVYLILSSFANPTKIDNNFARSLETLFSLLMCHDWQNYKIKNFDLPVRKVKRKSVLRVRPSGAGRGGRGRSTSGMARGAGRRDSGEARRSQIDRAGKGRGARKAHLDGRCIWNNWKRTFVHTYLGKRLIFGTKKNHLLKQE